MDTVLQHLNDSALLSLASRLQPEWGTCKFTERLNELPQTDNRVVIQTGGSLLLLLEFTDNPSRWSVRIPSAYGGYVDYWKMCIHPLEFVASEISHLPAPRVHAYDLSSTNSVGVPYMILDWVDGTPLFAFTDTFPSPEKRFQILDDMSDIILDLIFCPLDSAKDICYYGSIPGEPISTTFQWLTESVDRALLRNLKSGGDSDVVIEYLIQRGMVGQFVLEEYNNAPWVLMHCDLHGGNLIVDNDLKLKGIVDWDFTFAMPLQKAASWPKFLQFTPGAVPPGQDDKFMSHPADKEIFLRMLREKEIIRRGSSIVAQLMESSYERNFFENSLHMKTVHREWVKCHPHTIAMLRTAIFQLDELIAKHPELEFNQVAIETREKMDIRLAKFIYSSEN